MTIIQSKISTRDEEFRANYEHNCNLVELLAERQAQVRQGGSERAPPASPGAGQIDAARTP
jgi:hypothetical protein